MNSNKCKVRGCHEIATEYCFCRDYKFCETHLGDDHLVIEKLGHFFEDFSLKTDIQSLSYINNKINELEEKKKLCIKEAKILMSEIQADLQEKLKSIDENIGELKNDTKPKVNAAKRSGYLDSKHSRLVCKKEINGIPKDNPFEISKESSEIVIPNRHFDLPIINTHLQTGLLRKMRTRECFEIYVKESLVLKSERFKNFMIEDLYHKCLELEQIIEELETEKTPSTASSIRGSNEFIPDSQSTFVLIDKDVAEPSENTCTCIYRFSLSGYEIKSQESGFVPCRNCLLKRV